MGTFGGGTFGGSGSGGSGSAGVQLSTILQAMLRVAGITTLPGTMPSDDQFGEAVPLTNRMLASWNCDGHKIYTSSIAAYPLTAGQKIYTIGPGGDFDADRPLYIKQANILFPTSPVVRRSVAILDDAEWASVAIQDITGAPPYQLYYDGGLNSSGQGSIYIRFQPPDGYSLELYTWTALQSAFTSSDDVALFPPGYEEALVWNGGLRVAGMYPLEAKLSPVAPEMARQSLQALMTLNMNCPRIGTEAGLGSQSGGNARPWLDGPFGGGY